MKSFPAFCSRVETRLWERSPELGSGTGNLQGSPCENRRPHCDGASLVQGEISYMKCHSGHNRTTPERALRGLQCPIDLKPVSVMPPKGGKQLS